MGRPKKAIIRENGMDFYLCTGCKELLPLDYFYKAGNSIRSECKTCCSSRYYNRPAHIEQAYRKNYKGYNPEYYRKNKERIIKTQKKVSDKARRETKGKRQIQL